MRFNIEGKIYFMIKKSILIFIFICLCACERYTFSHKELHLNIIHMNDIHSHLEEETLDVTIDGIPTRVLAGGYPRALSVINSIRSKRAHTILLHAGDELQGTLYYTLFKGDADADLMNTIPWDAFVLGNHEFDNGDENLANFLEKLNVPIIAANVTPDSGDILSGMWEPYIIKNIDGEKVGIFGIDVKIKTMESSRPSSEIHFDDEAESAQEMVNLLTGKGVNKIIMLSHYGYSKDKDLASKVNGIDIIIDGDSHTLLGDFSNLGLSSQGNYPTKTISSSGETVCIAQAWSYSKIVGNLDVFFDKEGRVTKCEGTPILPVGEKFLRKNAQGDYTDINLETKDEIVKFITMHDNIGIYDNDTNSNLILQDYKVQVDQKKQEVIGEAPMTLRHIRIPGNDYLGNNGADLPLGSEVIPIVSKAFYNFSQRSDACILNAGGVRTNIDSGEITIDTAYTLLPFSSTLYEIEMTGLDVKQVLEDALSNFKDNNGSDGSFPYAYALKYDVDMNQITNNRILNLEIKNRATGEWSIIDPNMLYTIVTIDYLASGKDGYSTFSTVQAQGTEGVDTYLDYALGFVEYVKSKTAASEKVVALPSSEHCIKSYIKYDAGMILD